MRKKLILIFILFFTIQCGAQNTEAEWQRVIKPNSKAINVGVKIGFNSSMYFVSDMQLNDIRVEKPQNNYQLGYAFSAFVRFNMKKHFIQQEASYIISNGEITFNQKKGDVPLDQYTSIKSNIHSFEFPLLYGYHFVKKGPYGMSFFIGPSLQYIWNKENSVKFANFPFKEMKESFTPFNANAIIGTSVNISNVFIDLRYEIGLQNISKQITFGDEENNLGKSSLHRRRNVLTVSIGAIL